MPRIKNTIQHPTRGRLTCRVYDNGGATVDRYTVAFKGSYVPHYGMVYPYLACNDAPFHPQGFGQHGENREFLDGAYLGKRVAFDTLPSDVQKFIMNNI